MTTDFVGTGFDRIGERLYNTVITHVPYAPVRRAWLRHFGATVGNRSFIAVHAVVLAPRRLVIGDHVRVGRHTLLDARGGIFADHDVTIGADVRIVSLPLGSAAHNRSQCRGPIFIGKNARIAERARLFAGVSIGPGLTVDTDAVVTDDLLAPAVDTRVTTAAPAPVASAAG
ncbi:MULTISPECIES: acyltransferase [Nocardiaceae]|uniref:Uncharacterized protein n=1 Tax=Rhodococcoides kroppenstedtii TaxID=293050 RepID=A0ABS7NW02_9NOCA|nr:MULTISPECIES: hypothetical protein [Rhodococcus]AMY20489.1 UDP-3-O-(3-hydroxymyristoyl)glucosamine N-acyltransferase [Rhodococcus sp. PBTS 1]MBY6314317.1 hypothetical protein [Rhodococcus kroppenstedtii]MBY6322216.1 hypothetical protein [Rhodococcus kroppenstedtii]MBY6401035.1 hypothetical protein [Rhodococcus kroppenstedtii]